MYFQLAETFCSHGTKRKFRSVQVELNGMNFVTFFSDLPSPHVQNASLPSSTENEYFTWTDEETTILLNVASSYKNEQTNKGEEWGWLRKRYKELHELFIKRYQKNLEVDPLQFPNSKDTSIFSKDKIIAKLKRIKFCYQKAVDSGRQSRGGRVVSILFDECMELWSGYPAVEAMDNGIETMEEIPGSENPDRSESGPISWQ